MHSLPPVATIASVCRNNRHVFSFILKNIHPMEAVILAAGLGTRLRPLTNDKPKALVEAGGRPLLDIAIHRIAQAGADRIAVNVHHFGNLMIDYLSSRRWPVEVVVSDERKLLLDTGGGLKQAASLLSGKSPIIVYNVDILSRFSLSAMLDSHVSHRASATLAVSLRDTKRQLVFTPDGRLCGWHNRETDETLLSASQSVLHSGKQSSNQEFAFSGISIYEPSLIDLLPAPDHPYPFIPELLKLSDSKTIQCFQHQACDWLDVGTPQKLEQASAFLNRQ